MHLTRSASASRLPLRALRCSLAILLALLAAPEVRAGVRLLQADARGVTVEFTLEGLQVDTVSIDGARYSRVKIRDGVVGDRPGSMQLPGLSSMVGIPRSGDCRITVLEAEASEMGALPPQPVPNQKFEGGPDGKVNVEQRPNPGDYARAGLWPAQVATLGPALIMRLQRVQPFGVRPLRYDPARRTLWVARRMVVRVDFGASAEAGGAGQGFAADSRSDESMYRGALLNYEQARGLRRVGAAGAAAPQMSAGPRGPVSRFFPDFKVRIDTTGIYTVTFEQLQGRFSPEGSVLLDRAPVEQLRCWEELPAADPRMGGMVESEVPIRVIDADGDGIFGPGDQVVLFGLNLADRLRAHWFDPEGTSLYYTDGEVYWLGQRVAQGQPWQRMGPGGVGGSPGGYRPGTYRAVKHVQDRVVPAPGPESLDENVYLFRDNIAEDSVAFSAFDIDAVKPLDFRIAFRGRDLLLEGTIGTHILDVDLRRPQGTGFISDPVVTGFTFSNKGEAIFSSGPILSGASLSPDHNVLHFVGTHPPDGAQAYGSGAYLEWFDVGYHRAYRAPQRTNRFYFTSGDTLGLLAPRIANFGDSLIEVYDFTDSLRPRYIETAGSRARAGVRWYADFKDTCSTSHLYFASTRSALPRLPDAAVAVDTPSSLATLASGDMIIVTHESLEAQALELAAQHASQGLTVRVARVGDVYDEFDGGRKSDVAIKRFVRRAFYTWSTPPRYLLLLGESSENPQGHPITFGIGAPGYISHKDLVPSPRAFGSVPLGIDYEVIPEDYFYSVGLDTLDSFPILPALAVGRIPASTAAEAEAVVQKIIRYEHPQPGETWRSRNLFMADDEWSNGVAFGNNCLSFNSQEFVFQEVSKRLARIPGGEGKFGYFGADSFYLSQYSDTVHLCDSNIGGLVCRNWSCINTYGHSVFGAALRRKLTNSYLLVNYHGHANAQLMTHEYIYTGSGNLGDDVQQVGNIDRPFFLSAFACHVNKYDGRREGEDFYGNGLGERQLLAPQKGAIATFASTGFEWLPNSGDDQDLSVYLFRSFFVNPPEPDLGGRAGQRWILGDVIRDAKTRFAATFLSGFSNPGGYWCGYGCKPPLIVGSRNIYENFSYCLLGDPALHMDAGDVNVFLTQNGLPVGDKGYFVAGSSDSVTLAASALTPTGLDSAWVEDRPTGGAVRSIARSLYRVTAARDSGSAAPRGLTITYRTAPAFEDYYVDFKTRDLRGLVSTASIHRVLSLSDFTSNRGQLDTTHTAPSEMTIQVTVTSSTPVDSSRFTFDLNGQTLAPTSLALMVDRPEDGGLRHYTASLLHTFPAGTNTFGFTAPGPAGSASLRKLIRFRVATAGDFALSEVINYPNPFEASTSFHFSLTQAVDRASVRIYTISGRLLRELRDPDSGGGVHFLPWDGTDADGDPIANGTYIYKVVAESGGKKLEKIGTLVRVQR